MQEALEAVHRGRSVRRAVGEYNVPRGTAHDRESGHVQPGASCHGGMGSLFGVCCRWFVSN